MIPESLMPTLEKYGVVKFDTKEKFYLLSYIAAISNAGQDERKAIANKIYEYEKTNKPFLLYKVKIVKHELDKGRRFSQALHTAGIINDREYHILQNAKGGMANGIEKIIETGKRSNKSKVAITLMIFPPAIMLLVLLFSFDAVKGVVDGALEPIRSAGGKPPPVPSYLMDITTYVVANVVFFTTLISLFIGSVFVKRTTPRLYLKLTRAVFPVIEEEYTLDILKSLQTVMSGGGINLSNAAKALANGEPDNIKRAIFETIIDRTSVGKEKISDIFEEFNMNYNTVSSLRIGEDSNNIQIGIDIALEDIEKRYVRDIKIFTQIGMWGGQFAMLGIAGKPMIDIMLLMSVGQLNFQLE